MVTHGTARGFGCLTGHSRLTQLSSPDRATQPADVSSSRQVDQQAESDFPPSQDLLLGTCPGTQESLMEDVSTTGAPTTRKGGMASVLSDPDGDEDTRMLVKKALEEGKRKRGSSPGSRSEGEVEMLTAQADRDQLDPAEREREKASSMLGDEGDEGEEGDDKKLAGARPKIGKKKGRAGAGARRRRKKNAARTPGKGKGGKEAGPITVGPQLTVG